MSITQTGTERPVSNNNNYSIVSRNWKKKKATEYDYDYDLDEEENNVNPLKLKFERK
jgi:hypothetical protein